MPFSIPSLDGLITPRRATIIAAGTAGISFFLLCTLFLVVSYQSRAAEREQQHAEDIIRVIGSNIERQSFQNRKALEEALRQEADLFHGIVAIEVHIPGIQTIRALGQRARIGPLDYIRWREGTRPSILRAPLNRRDLYRLTLPTIGLLDAEASSGGYLVVGMQPVGRAPYLLIALSALMGFGLTAGVVFGLGRRLSDDYHAPLSRLTEHMRDILKSQDYSLQIDKAPDNEIGTLYEVLNEILFEMNARSEQLAIVLDEVTEAKDAAEAANLAKSQFLANMSHELRTPLNAIIGYSEIVIEDLEDAGMTDTIEDVRRVVSSANHLLGLINQVLDLSKIESGRAELDVHEIDVAVLVRETAATVQPLVHKNGNELIVEIAKSVGTAKSDSVKIKQCLLNLLSNAAKFTKDGEIRLSVRSRKRDDEDWYDFEVSDSGIGMTTEQLTKLFQPFVQADASTTRNYGGTGLGLTITKRMAEMLGGTINVTSEIGAGSCFTMTIPAVAPPLSEEAQQENAIYFEMAQKGQAGDGQGAEKPLALVVDEDPEALELMMRWLPKMGYRVAAAGSQEEGLQLVGEHGPDIIILNGDEMGDEPQLMNAIRNNQSLRHIPTIVTSKQGRADEETQDSDRPDNIFYKAFEKETLAPFLVTFKNRGERTVLVVEDNLATAELLARLISRRGFRALTAHSGEEALEMVRKSRPHCLVVDLRLPMMSGLDFIKAVNTATGGRPPPTIAITAMTLSNEEVGALEPAVSSLHYKGALTPAILLTEINRVLSKPASPLPNPPANEPAQTSGMAAAE